jgi:uncharacterized membrane protein
MSIAHFMPSMAARGPSRWLLLGSLALNLFFVGVAVAFTLRPAPPPPWHRNVFVRIDRLAGSLPAADGDLLRAGIKAHRGPIEAAQSQYRGTQDATRTTLRQEPFDIAALQAAMAKTRAARQNFDQAIHEMFAAAAGQMSPAGRRALADWPPGRKTAGNR